MGLGHIVDDIFVFLELVALNGHGLENQAQLVLTGSNLMVMLVNGHADGLHGGEHLGTDVLTMVNRGLRGSNRP